jgi:hypothetical protein
VRKRYDKLPPLAQEFLHAPAGQRDRTFAAVRRFHRWLVVQNMTLAGLSAQRLESFFDRPFRKPPTPKTIRDYKYGLIGYLTWLYEGGHLSFDPSCLRTNRRAGYRGQPELTSIALEYLRTPEGRGAERVVRRFHRWLAAPRNHMAISALQPEDVERFFEQPFRKLTTPRVASAYCYRPRQLIPSRSRSTIPAALTRLVARLG